MKDNNLNDSNDFIGAPWFEDYSTSLYNRNFFIKNMENISLRMIKGIAENQKYGNDDKTWSILFCDIDGLKLANDTMGHLEADSGIKYIADTIKSCIRTHRKESDSLIYPDIPDASNDNIPIRFGGDEFIVILPNCTKDKAIIIEERIKKHISENKNQTRNMSLSIGIADTSEAKIPTDTNDKEIIKSFLNDIITIAEKRMYYDKNKNIKNLSLEEKKNIIAKHLNRIANQVGLNINNSDDIDIFIDILNDIKEEKKEKRTK